MRDPVRYQALLAALVLAVGWGLGGQAAAQDFDVLVQIDPRDPIADATALEMFQRGLRASTDEAPRAADATARARESRTTALALGARAAVWIDAGADGRSLVIRALRADDDEQGASVVGRDDAHAEPRLAALVAGTLVEEILARPARPVPPPVAPSTSVVGPTEASAHAHPPPLGGPPLRAYGTFAADGWLRFTPAISGGMSLRASTGAEWPDGLRVGAYARVLWGPYSGVIEGRPVSRFTVGVIVGAEVIGRIQVPGHALIIGANAALGPSQRGPEHGDRWDLSTILGAVVGLAFPVGHHGAEMGVQIGVDTVLEADRGVAVMPSLGLRWDVR